jgi:hypothetical protein
VALRGGHCTAAGSGGAILRRQAGGAKQEYGEEKSSRENQFCSVQKRFGVESCYGKAKLFRSRKIPLTEKRNFYAGIYKSTGRAGLS